MISFSNVGKQFGKRLVLVDASFQLNAGEKVGLVGPNGAGKTTIFRLLTGEELPDDGALSIPKNLTIGYFRQDSEEMHGRTVLEEAIAGSGRLGELHHEISELEHAMADPERADEMDSILERFGEAQAEYQDLGGYEIEARAREVLHGLGFEARQVDGDVGALSGGWKMRVSMAKVLLTKADVLLLDEPTNHLDIESILWLEDFLKATKAAVLMTCHDRDFMNRVVTRLLELDGGELTSYSGDYDFYEREQALRAQQKEAQYARQQAMLAKEQRFIDRFEKHAAKAAQVQSRIKKLEKIELVEPPKRREIVPFDFKQPGRSGDDVLKIHGLNKRYGDKIIYEDFDFEIRRGERWCVMGVNGAGKSTLLKIVVGAQQPDSGTVKLGASLKLGYFAQQALDLLDPNLTIWEQIEHDFPMESISTRRNLLGCFQFSGDDVEKPIRILSGGERSRLVLARMLMDPPNFLVLDEPTNHLDLITKEMLVQTLAKYEGTMLFVSHDRTFLRGLATRVLDLSGETVVGKSNAGAALPKTKSGRPLPVAFPASYAEWVRHTGHEAPGVHA
ncbi:MAG: ABC-F family ATP-binding cassette domain-containing protein [Planctomycetes bacterium]|nr:ABC-F family ATP-binding cassette domain-containing protein [Planctomycetota bacterium]